MQASHAPSTEAELISEAQLMLRQAQRRLAELEQIAAAIIERDDINAAERAGTAAAAEHLTEHARLCGQITEGDSK